MSSTIGRPLTAGIDPRGPRFTAGVTSLVLVVILVLPTAAAGVLTAVQVVLFTIGVSRGVQRTPVAWLFRRAVRPRLEAPAQLEDPAPPRFAQGVGLVFTAVALVGFLTGATLLGQVAVGLALVAALLNVAFDFCLGCELYLLLKRVTA